ncbi:hypothetical protein SDC9_65877 [bioreactor metagenome]|uniref:Bacterial repeat domain-containing protein n=1 Tax=bioreactor metagenome TaxID=1076179 RepID=A0A644XYU3_9ZZZZ
MRPAFNSGEVYGYRSASFYNSVINANLQKFRVTFGDGIYGIAGYYGANSLGRSMDDTLADILGIRYVFTNYKSEEQGWELLEKYIEKDETNITPQYLYKNKDIGTAGLLFYNWYPEEKFTSMDITNRQAQLPFSVSLDQKPGNIVEGETVKPKIISAIEKIDTDMYSFKTAEGVYELYPASIENGETQDIEKGIHISFKSEEMSRAERRIWLNFDIKSENEGQLIVAVNNGNGYSSVYWANHEEKIEGQSSATVKMPLPTDTKQVVVSIKNCSRVAVSNIKVLATDGRNYTNEGINLQNPAKGGLIVGTVSTQEPAILVIPVFCEPGWEAFVDGKPIEILKADGGLCGLEVSSGIHAIELRYDTPQLCLGASISMIGFFFWITLIFLRKRIFL